MIINLSSLVEYRLGKVWKLELENITFRGNSGRDFWEWGWEKALRSQRNQGKIETWNWIPEKFQRACSPVVPEPGCTLELPGEMLKICLLSKLQNVKCDRKFQGKALELVSLQISLGDWCSSSLECYWQRSSHVRLEKS